MTDQPTTTEKNWTRTFGEAELDGLRTTLAREQKHHDERVADLNERIAKTEAEIAVEHAHTVSQTLNQASGLADSTIIKAAAFLKIVRPDGSVSVKYDSDGLFISLDALSRVTVVPNAPPTDVTGRRYRFT